MHNTLYLDHQELKLSLQSKFLTIHQQGKYLRSIPLHMLDRIVCRSSIEIKTAVLARLSASGIAVIIFGGRFGKLSALVLPGGTKDVSRRIRQYEIFSDPLQRSYWATRLISHKLQTQSRLLFHLSLKRKDASYVLTKAQRQIKSIRLQCLSENHLTLESLRGYEGAAANIYFKALQEVFPASLQFNGRNRRPPKDPVNALLSLGYTLIDSEVQQTLAITGLDLFLGIYHEPEHGRASLACDLTELYRHHIDRLSWHLINDRELRNYHFKYNDEACLLSKEGRQIYYPIYEKMAQSLRPKIRKFLLKLITARE
jgi:CRISPR-associated protein Cas1